MVLLSISHILHLLHFQVCYAGVSYPEGYVRKGHRRPKLPGIEACALPGVHTTLYCNALSFHLVKKAWFCTQSD